MTIATLNRILKANYARAIERWLDMRTIWLVVVAKLTLVFNFQTQGGYMRVEIDGWNMEEWDVIKALMKAIAGIKKRKPRKARKARKP